MILQSSIEVIVRSLLQLRPHNLHPGNIVIKKHPFHYAVHKLSTLEQTASGEPQQH